MSNKPMLSVERELLENIALGLEKNGFGINWAVELRALLDRPETPYVPKAGWSFKYVENGVIVIRNGEDWTIIKPGDGPIYEQFLYRFCEEQLNKPAAQHHGEPVAVVMHVVLNETPKCQQIQPDEAAMLNNGDYCAEELFGAGGVKTCPGCEHCDINKMFEAAYRAQSTGPAFIVDDALLKDADGNYFHLATRAAFKFFKMGRESWTN